MKHEHEDLKITTCVAPDALPAQCSSKSLALATCQACDKVSTEPAQLLAQINAKMFGVHVCDYRSPQCFSL